MRVLKAVVVAPLCLLLACGSGESNKGSEEGAKKEVASRGLPPAEQPAGYKAEPAAEQAAPSEVSRQQPQSKAEGDGLTDFERSLVGPILEDIRKGVRPFNDEGIGICKGNGKRCVKYLGSDPGELPPGDYMVRAELAVPRVGEPGLWKIKFESECTTTTKRKNTKNTSTRNYSQDYEVRYHGGERGYRLSPLKKIKSPHKGGKQSCTYKITAPHPDGDKVYTGSWSVAEG